MELVISVVVNMVSHTLFGCWEYGGKEMKTELSFLKWDLSPPSLSLEGKLIRHHWLLYKAHLFGLWALKICILVMKIYFQNVSFCVFVFKWVIIIDWYLILVFQWSVKNGGGEDCDCERCYWSKTFKSLP